ncbi:translation initiation factor IF-2-like [Lutra lutra]|uniref:translation initiation factor IF-2-like n=1 Tax=Lutra lutra TaxID=9657 RepID=UPI001FD3B75D|nr:translation initiation factor IF-2-like [Lutra lutra]
MNCYLLFLNTCTLQDRIQLKENSRIQGQMLESPIIPILQTRKPKRRTLKGYQRPTPEEKGHIQPWIWARLTFVLVKVFSSSRRVLGHSSTRHAPDPRAGVRDGRPPRLVPVCNVVAHGPGSDRTEAPSPSAPLLGPSAGAWGASRSARVPTCPASRRRAPRPPPLHRARREPALTVVAGRRDSGRPRPAAGPVPKPPSGLSARRGRTRGPGGCRSPGSGLPAGAALLREGGGTLCPRRRYPRPPGPPLSAPERRSARPRPHRRPPRRPPPPVIRAAHGRGSRGPGAPSARGGLRPARSPQLRRRLPARARLPGAAALGGPGVLRPSSAPRAPPPAAAPAAHSSRVRAPHQQPGRRWRTTGARVPGASSAGGGQVGGLRAGAPGGGRATRARAHPRVRLPAPRETRPQSSRNAGASSPPPRPASEPAELRAVRGSARVTRGAALRPPRGPGRAGCGDRAGARGCALPAAFLVTAWRAVEASPNPRGP